MLIATLVDLAAAGPMLRIAVHKAPARAKCCCNLAGAGECPMCRRMAQPSCCGCTVQGASTTVVPRWSFETIAVVPRAAVLPWTPELAGAPALRAHAALDFVLVPPTPPPRA